MTAACSRPSAPTVEDVVSSGAPLLAAPCVRDSSGNLTLTMADGEVGYLGYWTGCTQEPCIITNAVSSFGEVCLVNSSGKKITVNGTGMSGNAEKLILDYTHKLFGEGEITVALDTQSGVGGALSSIRVMPPATGSNMALGTSGLDIDTTTTRGTPALDVTLKWSTSTAPGSIELQGGPGDDAFVADAAGLTSTLPAVLTSAGWNTSASLAAIVGSAYAGPLTLSGGAGNDVLAGGAGVNTLTGGAGDDTFLEGADSRTEVMQGGDGFDTVDYSLRSANVVVTIGVEGAVGTVAVDAVGSGGAGYKVGDILALVGGVTPAMVKVIGTGSGGTVTIATVLTPGSGYTLGATAVASTDTTTATASGATFDILAGVVQSASVVSGGTGYSLGNTLTLVQGSETSATVTITEVDGAGIIVGTSILAAGSGYASGLATVTGGTGSGATFDVTSPTTADDGQSGEGDSVANDIEMVIGGSGSDTLDARAILLSDVVLVGGGGNDSLRGGSGSDDLCGGSGNDQLYWSGCSLSSGSCASGSGTQTGDYLSGGPGLDTVEYSVASGGVVVCLNPADVTTPGEPCNSPEQNGTLGNIDTINKTGTLVCPGARPFTIACGGQYNTYAPGKNAYTCGSASYTTIPAGASMSVDVENITGHPSQSNTLDCGAIALVACTVVGGTASDLIMGTAGADSLTGHGGADTILTKGGTDLVDFTGSVDLADPVTDRLDCDEPGAGNVVTVLVDSVDAIDCATAAGSGVYTDVCATAGGSPLPTPLGACVSAEIIQH
jgi:Ca2+-binding RTX toxin-like protein